MRSIGDSRLQIDDFDGAPIADLHSAICNHRFSAAPPSTALRAGFETHAFGVLLRNTAWRTALHRRETHGASRPAGLFIAIVCVHLLVSASSVVANLKSSSHPLLQLLEPIHHHRHFPNRTLSRRSNESESTAAGRAVYV
jgi:hypothetical protein